VPLKKEELINLSICWHFCGWSDKNLNSHIKMYDTTLMFKQFFSHLNIIFKKIYEIYQKNKNYQIHIKIQQYFYHISYLFLFQAYSSYCHYFWHSLLFPKSIFIQLMYSFLCKVTCRKSQKGTKNIIYISSCFVCCTQSFKFECV